jgi:hypothetical protein
MEKSFADSLNMKGHLTISKVSGGSEEIIFDEKNVIVSGFGYGLAYLFSRLGSTNIADFQIDRFQLGTAGSLANQVSSTYQLSSPLSSLAEYIGTTGDSNLFAFSSIQIKNGTQSTSPTPFFAKIPFTKVTKVDDRTVRYTIFVDEDSCNNVSRSGSDANLNEIGLFMKNPLGTATDASILVAYKYFSNIRKTDDFGLIFRWTISLG